MRFLSRQAPYWRQSDSISTIMLLVIAALMPTLLVSSWLFGSGILINTVFACATCLLLETMVMRLRNRPAMPALLDGSALVTAILIALALPALTPWWVTATACLFAIVFAKHLYGGLGYNVFNPAMIGYVVVLISFPQFLAVWPATDSTPGLTTTLGFFFTGQFPAGYDLDGLTQATPLDSIDIQLGQMRTMTEIMAADGFSWLAGYGWEWINIAALLGGLALLKRGIIRWQIPVAMLVTMLLLYSLFYLADSALHTPPLIGLFSGATMLGAFFIATDPVSAATTDRGRIVYGAGIGALCFAIREWGAYPDGLAFAVIIMNMSVPLIDRFTVTQVSGR